MSEPKIYCSHDEIVDIDSLIENPHNPNKHPEKQLELLAKIITNQGWRNPITVSNRSGFIVKGHGRLQAAKMAGLSVVPVDRQDYETEAQEWADMVADNRIAELAEVEKSELKDLLQELDTGDFDMELTGFDELALEELMTQFHVDGEVEEDDFDAESEAANIAEPITKHGDVWKLGSHRLMCGDSTVITDVEKLMDGKKATLAHNDPPYGMKKENDGVLNDNLNLKNLLEFNSQWIPICFSYLEDNGSFYCWGTDEPLMDIYSEIIKPYIKEQKATFRNLITWDKGNGQGQNSDNTRMYAIADEKCLFVMCGVQGFEYARNEEQYNIIFEKVRKYFENEKNKCGLSIFELSKIDSTRVSHYWAKVQFEFPTKEAYIKIKEYCQNNGIDAFKKEYDELKKEYDELKKEYYSTRAYFNNTHDNFNNVWHFKRDTENKSHVTPKPLALCTRVIKTSSNESDIVVDLFGGSGSTLIAAEQTNRICYMMELSETYCDVIIKRWEQLTGQKAELIGGE